MVLRVLLCCVMLSGCTSNFALVNDRGVPVLCGKVAGKTHCYPELPPNKSVCMYAPRDC